MSAKIDKNLKPLVDFLKDVGVTSRAVHYAREKDKLPSMVKVGRKWFVHKTKTKKEWDQNRDQKAVAKGNKRKKITSKRKRDLDDTEIVAPKMFDGLTFADAERQEKVYKARMAQLKYQEQAGELIHKNEVKTMAFELARKVRDSILNIPARVAHELAAETDPHKLEHALHKELLESLEKLSEVANDS